MKSPRTFPRLVMKDWPVQKRLNSESGDRDMSQDARTECSMVERVTKAIFDEMDIADGLDGTVAERYARRAIEAMREPTEAQIDAACVARIPLYPAWEGEKPQPTAGEVISVSYRAMIDAALNENSVREFS